MEENDEPSVKMTETEMGSFSVWKTYIRIYAFVDGNFKSDQNLEILKS